MKRLGLFMTVIMILCITVNAQKQSNLRRPGLARQILAQQCGNGRCLVTSRIAFPAPKLGSL